MLTLFCGLLTGMLKSWKDLTWLGCLKVGFFSFDDQSGSYLVFVRWGRGGSLRSLVLDRLKVVGKARRFRLVHNRWGIISRWWGWIFILSVELTILSSLHRSSTVVGPLQHSLFRSHLVRMRSQIEVGYKKILGNWMGRHQQHQFSPVRPLSVQFL